MENKYQIISNKILNQIGGVDNITSVMHCFTRLRINIKDKSLVNLDEIKKLDVIGAQFMGDQLQIIIGNNVIEMYNEFIKLTGLNNTEVDNDVEEKNIKKTQKKLTIKSIVENVIDVIVSCMVPILPTLVASGLLKAIVLILTNFNIVRSDSPTIFTLSFVADSAFYFLPVILAVFAAKKFETNIALSVMLGASMIHPDFVARALEGHSLSIFGLPIFLTNYSSTVIPIILAIWVMSYVEKVITKISPKSLRSLILPLFTILIMIPLTFVVLAPLGALLSKGFATGLEWFYATFGIFAIAAFCALVPWVVMLGLHVGSVPISIQSIASTGIDKMILPAFVICNFAQGAACLAVGFKSKSSDLKSLAFSSSFSMIIPGVSEPGMYGITLRYKTPMWATMIGSGIGGLYYGITGVGAFSFLPPNIFALAGFVGTGKYSSNIMNAVIGIAIAMIISFLSTLVLYKPKDER